MAAKAKQVALVTGASGIVGAGLVRAFLQRGVCVVAPMRSERGVQSLQDELKDVPHEGLLDTPIADVSDESSIQALADSVRKQHTELDHVISSIGGWWEKGPLLEQTTSEVDLQFHNYVTSHFMVAKAFLPLLKDSPRSSYTFITGGAGEIKDGFPAKASIVRVVCSGLYGVVACIIEETKEKAYRVNEARISSSIRRQADVEKGVLGYAQMQPISNWICGERVVADVAESKKKGEVVQMRAEQFKA